MLGANDTITIWNKHHDPTTKKDIWYRHVVSKCSWESEIIKSVSGTTAIITSIFEVLISESPNYKPYNEWRNLDADGKASFFTLYVGDLVAKGEFLEEITNLSPYTVTDLKNKLLPDVFMIKTVCEADKPYKMAPHYEITGV